MKYYDVHIEIPKQGYSVGLKSEVELTYEEIVLELIRLDKFEEKGDSDFIDSFEEITEDEFNEWF